MSTDEKPVAPRRRIGREARRKQLIRVSEVEFAKHGFKGTTVNQIAQAAGVDTALIYQHFGDKQSLYQACIADALSELMERIENHMPQMMSNDPALATRYGVDMFFQLIEERPSGWDLVFEAGLQPDEAEGRPAMVNWVTGILEFRAPKMDRTQLEVLAVATLSASWGISRWWRGQDGVSREEVVELESQIFERILEPINRAASED